MYTSRQKLETVIPAADLVAALDDDGDGLEDAGLFETLLEVATEKVDAYLDGRYSNLLPFANPPALVKTAALAFLAESIYTRRPGADAPTKITREARACRDRLEKIQEGKANLSADKAENAPVSIIASPSSVHSRKGLTF
jgi:phage gp36-like protein